MLNHQNLKQRNVVGDRKMKNEKKRLPGFKNVQVEKDGKARVVIDDDEMAKLMKKYKKLKKYQKSNLYMAAKLGGIDNELDRLLREYSDESKET